MSDLPVPADSDSENVVWLLSTAASLWTKGEQTEAMRWLDRAANAARDEGDVVRHAQLVAAMKRLVPAAAPRPSQEAMKKVFQRTMQSKPPSNPSISEEARPLVEVRSPEPVLAPMSMPAETRISGHTSEPPEVLSSRDLQSDRPADGASTQRFDYPASLEQLAKPSQPALVAAAPATDVLPAIRVWIVAGRVVPAVGGRPAGAADAILLGVVPGVDLASLLAERE
jgi:hypothetical protein